MALLALPKYLAINAVKLSQNHRFEDVGASEGT